MLPTRSTLLSRLPSADRQTALAHSARTGAGYEVIRKKTLGAVRMIRPSMGLKLWEDMTEAEQWAEFRSRLQDDLAVAQQEAVRPIDYVLTRALAPLDPMAEIYKAMLKRAGATETAKGIVLSPALELAWQREQQVVYAIPLCHPAN